MQLGVVFNIQKYSIHDGPGIRTTVFLKGCTLRCWWCHNPESYAVEPEISLVENRCGQCGQCVDVCPQTNGAMNVVLPYVDRERCIRCGECVAACATGARQMVGQNMSVQDVMTEVLKDRIFYDDSGGGATLSGGEPLMQPDFCQAILEACQSEAVHSAVDTCGFVEPEHLLAVAPLTDLFLYDIKVMDDQRHREHTGASNALILENLRALSRVHDNIWVRIPVVPGLNDNARDLQDAARFCASLRGVRQVNLLPYHEMGSGKTGRIGKTVATAPVSSPSVEQMEDLAESIRGLGLPVQIGG